jgi:hypothetical protein
MFSFAQFIYGGLAKDALNNDGLVAISIPLLSIVLLSNMKVLMFPGL